MGSKKGGGIGGAFASAMTTLDGLHDAPFDMLGMGENNSLRRASNLMHDIPYKNLGIKTAEEQKRDIKLQEEQQRAEEGAMRAASEKERLALQGRRRGMLSLINTSARGVTNPLAPEGKKLGGY